MLLISFQGISQKITQTQTAIFQKEGLANRGYDPVAYFTKRAALKGNINLSYKWQGVKWFFASENRQTLFVEKPEKNLPEYGGYCA